VNTLNFYEDLSQDIVSNDRFIEDFEQLTRFNFADKESEIEFDLQKRLIESAAILACSNEENHKRIALKIAGVIMENKKSNELLRAASDLIFLRIGNFPLLQMSVFEYNYRDFLNIWESKEKEYWPIALSLEVAEKVTANSFEIRDQTVYLTDFQTNVFNLLRNKRNVSISAPTSAGKSFVLTRYVIDHLLKNKKSTVIYIVPTRALIAQIQNEFRKILNNFSIRDTDIRTSLWEIIGEGKREYSKAIFILTQERLQSIEGKVNHLDVDLLIVDEAHKIEEGARGIWLEESIQQIIDWNPDLQIVFISPFTTNPEKFGKIFLYENLEVIHTRLPPVHQNLLFVDIKNKNVKIWQGSQELKRRFKLAEYETQQSIPREFSDSEKKAWIAKNIAESGSIMIYCNRPADCRKTAKAYSDMKTEKVIDNKIDEFISFLKNNIHPQYYLIDFLEKGVGYHYSNMPPSVKSGVESLFSQKIIDTICCTSTLLEGVNFPAKSILIYKPRRGMQYPMDELTFWNLAGRAGRLMKDFSGNIYCVNVDSWPGYKPKLEEGTHTIQSSMEVVISNKEDKIIGHLKDYSRKGKEDDVKAAVTRFLIKEILKGSDKFVEQLIERNADITKDHLDEIVAYLTNIASNIALKGEIISKNGSIDPRLQNNLYTALKKLPSLPIPVHPAHHNFYDSLRDILSLINKCFKRDYNPESFRFISWLSSNWSNEKTLGEIIHQRIDFLEKKGTVYDKKNINREIEDIIKTINQKLTYEICRDLSCYIDILKFVSQERGINVSQLDEKLPYYIEIGASKPTTLALMNNGIPRTVAILISRKISPDIQDFNKFKKYIRDNKESLKKQISSILFDELFM